MSKYYIYIWLAILLAIAIGLADQHGYSRAERDQAKKDSQALKEAVEKRDALQAQIQTMADENAGLMFKLRNTQLEASRYATEAQRNSRLLRGAISVLNERRGYPVGSPDNPSLTTAETTQPSPITGDRAFREWEQCEIDYQIARQMHATLVDACTLLQ